MGLCSSKSLKVSALVSGMKEWKCIDSKWKALPSDMKKLIAGQVWVQATGRKATGLSKTDSALVKAIKESTFFLYIASDKPDIGSVLKFETDEGVSESNEQDKNEKAVTWKNGVPSLDGTSVPVFEQDSDKVSKQTLIEFVHTVGTVEQDDDSFGEGSIKMPTIKSKDLFAQSSIKMPTTRYGTKKRKERQFQKLLNQEQNTILEQKNE